MSRELSSSNSIITKSFRENLKALRELRGLTQTQLGHLASIPAASISNFETGQRVPSLESLVKLADALRVSIDALVGRAPVESAAELDPVFQRASRADARTLDAVRRVTEALLAGASDRRR